LACDASVTQLVLASSNPGKLRELAELFAPLGIEVVPQGALGVPDADEPHATFVENALAKARNAARRARLPALADDSGICVAALDGEPGVHSARFAGEPKSDQRNNEKLVALLEGKLDRRAHYYCVVVLVRHAEDPEPLIAEGRWHGEVVTEREARRQPPRQGAPPAARAASGRGLTLLGLVVVAALIYLTRQRLS
jgi:XTP/dITP diphosphohydrolase